MKRIAAIILSILAASPALAETVEKTIAVPKHDQSVKVGFSSGGATIESVRIQNYPDSEQVAKARREKPDDKSFVFWRFSVGNQSSRKVKIKIDVEVIGKGGDVIAHNDKSDTVDAGRDEDNIRVMMHPRILDLVDARSARLKLSIEPK
jgi:hypothetical protein